MGEFIYQGKEYTRESFAAEFNLDENACEEVLSELIARGLVTTTEEPTAFEKFMKDNDPKTETHRQAEEIRANEAYQTQKEREERTRNVPKYLKGGNFAFTNMYDAKDFINRVVAKGISGSCISQTIDGLTVTVSNITETELNSLVFIYKTKQYTDKATKTLEKGVRTTTKAVDYAAKNVVMPVAKTCLKGLGDLAKTVAVTAKRAGSAAVSATADAVRNTSAEMQDDPTVIIGKDDLNTIKNAVKGKFGFSGPASGITFN